MKAVFFHQGSLSLRQTDEPGPRPGWAVVRPLLAGICRTDIELFSGYYAFSGIPGHEFVGVVASCPDRPELVGRRVAGDINVGCGACPFCAAGEARHCPDRLALGIKGLAGAFAEALTLPAANLHPVPDQVPDRTAVLAEPLAAALRPLDQGLVRPSDRLLVLGDGKLGLLLALALRRAAAETVLAGRHANKLALARSFGLTALPSDAPELSRLAPFDAVAEATGRPEGLSLALSLVRPGGTVIAKTTSHEPSPLPLSRLVVDEIRLAGSRCGEVCRALAWMAETGTDLSPLIEAEYPFDAFPTAFDHARRPGALKILLSFPRSPA